MSISLADNDVRYVPDEDQSHGFCAVAHESRYLWTAEKFDMAGKRVLDFGCGSGYGAAILSARGGADVLGCDRSGESVSYANSRYGTAKCRFEAADLQDRSFPRRFSAPFDFLVSFDVIEHVERYYDFARNSSELLSPSGVAVIGCPNRLQTFAWNDGWNLFHLQEFTPCQLHWLLSHYFESVVIYGQDIPDADLKAALQPKKNSAVESPAKKWARRLTPPIFNAVQRRLMPRPQVTIGPENIRFIKGEAPDFPGIGGCFGLVAVCERPITPP